MDVCLTYRFIDEVNTKKCLLAENIYELRTIIKSINASNDNGFINTCLTESGKLRILLDLYAQLIFFCRRNNFTIAKVSTLIGIVCIMHTTSMKKSYISAEAYLYFRKLLLEHSVPHPPFSVGIFLEPEVCAINTYILSSYFRHYNLYIYAFAPREVALVRCSLLGEANRSPPRQLPPLTLAIPYREWEAKQEESRRVEEARLLQTEALTVAQRATEEREELINMKVAVPQLLSEQLAVIKTNVVNGALDVLDGLEQRLTTVEGAIAECARKNNIIHKRR